MLRPMEQMINKVTADELIPSAHHHAKPMLADAFLSLSDAGLSHEVMCPVGSLMYILSLSDAGLSHEVVCPVGSKFKLKNHVCRI